MAKTKPKATVRKPPPIVSDAAKRTFVEEGPGQREALPKKQATTVHLPPELVTRARIAALHRRTTFSALVEEGLERVLFTKN